MGGDGRGLGRQLFRQRSRGLRMGTAIDRQQF